MDLGLSDRACILTGASRGIGAATALGAALGNLLEAVAAAAHQQDCGPLGGE